MGESVPLPTGTVTLLLADVEGSTRMWESEPEEMTAAVARLDRTVADVIATYRGVRPAEVGEGDSLVAAFAHAFDAVACALELQRAPLSPIRLRIGIHTGEVQLRDEVNYVGSTLNRTARLRDLAHGGQTVLSGLTEELVFDRLPDGAWLSDRGSYQLRDVTRPERVVQLCHRDLHNEFPPLRSTNTSVVAHHLPVQLTSFVGREAETAEVRQILTDYRLVTLTGSGGAGKTRLAVQIAAQMAGEFDEGVWYVDLAPITDPGIVPVVMARALGLPDQPGRSTMDTLTGFIADRQMLVVLDNCEHLLDPSAALVAALLGACRRLTLLATSREPIGVAGEVSWHVPSLSLADEAIELFTDRARRVRPGFAVDDDNAETVVEICRRLDGMPLAIELAAARLRALSVIEIRDSLHDRFRLLTGGARTAVRRHQTLHASVDWSHALLTEPEHVLFRRLAAFLGGFDLDAAQAIAASEEVERYQVLDQLTLLVDKSLVVAEYNRGATRYRLLETVRQYAQEKLGESGEADAVRSRHRDHYVAMAALLDAPGQAGQQERLEQAEIEIDNLRAAFAWSRENCDNERALQLASSLQPMWLTRGRIREGLAMFDAVLTDETPNHRSVIAPMVRARSLADRAVLDAWVCATDSLAYAEEALAIARELGDPALLARALTACGCASVYDAELAWRYFAEAINLTRAVGDGLRTSQILGKQANAAFYTGDPIAMRLAALEGRDLAEAIGDPFNSRQCRWWLGCAHVLQGKLVAAIAQLRELIDEAEADHDVILKAGVHVTLGHALAFHGDAVGARVEAEAAIKAAEELGDFFVGVAYTTLMVAALANGDAALAADAAETAWRGIGAQRETAAMHSSYVAQAALARGDITVALRWADDAVAATTGSHHVLALTTRARVAITQGEPEQAERYAHDALVHAVDVEAYLWVPDILEFLAGLASAAGSQREAARLLGAADGIRQRNGEVRFMIHQAGYESSVAAVREAIGEADFDEAWGAGASLSIDQAIAYARRGRGERKRPTSGWASLTPTERDVVRLVTEGLANKDIAARLFISPRTVQTHLTHVYTKLGLPSRVKLIREAARHT